MLKMVMNYYCFQNRNFMQPLRRLSQGGLSVFSFGFSRGKQGIFFWGGSVPICSHCVHQVPNVFPKMFPITFQFLSHTKRATTSIYITCKREGTGRERNHNKALLICWVLRLLCCGVSPCSKNIDDGPIKWLRGFFFKIIFLHGEIF